MKSSSASGAANDPGAEPWCGGGGRSPKWPESDDDNDVAPDAGVVIPSDAAEDDSGGKSPVAPLPELSAPDVCVVIPSDEDHAHSSGGIFCGGLGGGTSGGKWPVTPLPKLSSPDACVVIRSDEDNTPSSGGLLCGGLGSGTDGTPGGKWPVAPLPHVAIRFAAVGYGSGIDSGSNQYNHPFRRDGE